MMQRQYINLMQRREQCSQHNFIAFHDLRQKFFTILILLTVRRTIVNFKHERVKITLTGE